MEYEISKLSELGMDVFFDMTSPDPDLTFDPKDLTKDDIQVLRKVQRSDNDDHGYSRKTWKFLHDAWLDEFRSGLAGGATRTPTEKAILSEQANTGMYD